MEGVPFIGEVVKEMKARPYTMLVIIGLAVAVPYMWVNYARADDVADLKVQVTAIDSSIKVAALETKLQAINTELFSLKQQVAAKQEAHEAVDALYTERIATLENDKAKAERTLEALDTSGP